MNIQEFLARKNVPFKALEHADTYDAQRMAEAVHESGHHVAKTVLLRAGNTHQYVVAVLPATHSIDFAKAAGAIGAVHASLATEVEIAERCPDCEIGALPPFGSHYNMTTIVDETLSTSQDIVFEGTTHHEAIRMKFEDFKKLEQPKVCSFSV